MQAQADREKRLICKVQPRDIGQIQLNEMGLHLASPTIMPFPFHASADDPFAFKQDRHQPDALKFQCPNQ